MHDFDGPRTTGDMQPPGGASSAEDRLESWKEIAGHFRCSVRAVQNWEKLEGLPVYRHRHKKLGTVYAYRSELDAWRRQREAAPAEEPRTTRRLPVTLLASLAVAAVTLGLWLIRAPGDVSSLHLSSPRRITSDASITDFPSWSPDGSSILYHSEADGSFDVWALELETGASRNLTAGSPDHERFPSWSPDGARIAFHSDRDGGGYYVQSLEDGAPTRVGDAPSDDPRVFHGVPQWSPDGSELAWLSMDPSLPEPAIVIRDLDGDGERRIDVPGVSSGRFDLAWSPDGRFFAYVDAHHSASDVASIWILDREQGRAHPVVERRRNDRRPAWSADGGSLVFLSEHDGSADLWLQPLDDLGRADGEPAALTAGVDVRHAALSRDGASLAYSRGRETANLWRLPVLEEGPATWEHAEALTFDDAFAEQPDLSPDRSEVAFVSDRRGGPRIWIVDIDDGALRPFSDEAHKAWAPRWSPDGSAIAYYSYRSGNRDVWIQPVEDGEARALAPHPADDLYPAWSPDGERIAFASDRGGSWDIWVVPAAGGEPRRMTTDPAIDTLPQWSPDGEWILFGSGRDETRLWKVPASGGDAVPSGIARSATVSQWRTDGRVFFHGRYESEGCIWVYDPVTESTRAATNLRGRRGGLWEETFTVRGDELVVSWKEETSDLWLMDARLGPM